MTIFDPHGEPFGPKNCAQKFNMRILHSYNFTIIKGAEFNGDVKKGI